MSNQRFKERKYDLEPRKADNLIAEPVAPPTEAKIETKTEAPATTPAPATTETGMSQNQLSYIKRKRKETMC
jgi:hypothetical protein